ncbi:oligosaccharide flippase family protein [Bacillus paranthracis]|uniref:lipopolysaccharide biosynthesis protein n=1 Tax=Bacillus paranthracis TaxID=2026186 RepID=UPI00254EAF87|nr:oligosaccharide flippase family protein [Bacillus paranthracis]MDK7539261.1 oligosaccharide flippase family protein [Bacillus paranthracis]MDK7561793.1 oligosaccharide flippase family protein [Bacillus paranthracis]
MNYIKQFIKTSGVFFLGNTLTKLISFFLLPLYTLKITPDAFGYYDLTISLINLIVPIIFFQVWDGIFRFTFDYEKKSDKYMVVSNGIVIQIFGFIMYLITFFIIVNLLNYDMNYRYLIFIYGILSAFQYYYNCVARSFAKNTLLVATGLLNSVISILLNVILISIYNMGIEALYISYIIGTLIQIIILEKGVKIVENFKINVISVELIKKLIKFSLPLCVITLSYWLLSGLVRLVISNKLGMQENGLYGVTNRLSSIIVLVVNVFQFAWYEMSYSMGKDANKKQYYKYSLDYILKVILYVGSVSLLIIKVVFPYMIAEQYRDALMIIPITFIGVLINSYVSFASTLFLAEKDSKKLLLPTLISVVVNMIGLVLLTENLGLIGATLSLAIAFFVNGLIITIKLKKQYNIKLDALNFLGGISVLIISTVAFYYIEGIHYLIACILFIIIISMYVFKDTFKFLLKMLKKSN